MTADSAAGLVQNISNVLSNTNEEDRTPENLDIVSSVLEDVVGLIDNGNFTINENV